MAKNQIGNAPLSFVEIVMRADAETIKQLQSGKKPEASNPGLSALELFETFLSSPL